jgi:hypothetical protein
LDQEIKDSAIEEEEALPEAFGEFKVYSFSLCFADNAADSNSGNQQGDLHTNGSQRRRVGS